MDTSQALIDTASELVEFGEFDSGAGGYLEKQMFQWAKEVWRRKSWPYKMASSTITVEAGNRGPYDLPADFALEVQEERYNQSFSIDLQILPETEDGPFNRIRPIIVNRLTNKGFLTFTPSSEDLTIVFNYIKRMTALSDLSTWPEEFSPLFIQGTKGLVLENNPDNIQLGQFYTAKANQLLKSFWADERRGQSKAEERVLRDTFGFPIAPNLDGGEWE